jgi:lipopolysaccharide/colanic/teichoic acid biosynthesis glycosyltransferase
MSKYPKYLREVIYALDFMIHRVLPKIPLLKRIYFTVYRGKGRVISEAEVLGRLYFCGFEVLASDTIKESFYFISRKVKHPSIDQNPSYGPFIKLRRIGYSGNVIYINKLRTMHPYSEYLQDYIYKQNRLQLNGKFRDDFRVTKWGKVFRKLWIDEIPQISNFLRGDISLVGVRALSEQYFNLYPGDLKNLRMKFKPGLVPPYYADMPNSFEEIVESEKQYLQAKQQKPFVTDVRYFFKAMYNIFFKKARSR